MLLSDIGMDENYFNPIYNKFLSFFIGQRQMVFFQKKKIKKLTFIQNTCKNF
jgi:hypothetical protein